MLTEIKWLFPAGRVDVGSRSDGRVAYAGSGAADAGGGSRWWGRVAEITLRLSFLHRIISGSESHLCIVNKINTKNNPRYEKLI